VPAVTVLINGAAEAHFARFRLKVAFLALNIGECDKKTTGKQKSENLGVTHN
jgi:hypothetical protein